MKKMLLEKKLSAHLQNSQTKIFMTFVESDFSYCKPKVVSAGTLDIPINIPCMFINFKIFFLATTV